ncbi:hypothetical protein AMK59_7965 [Oryctes borbonicus]|uniref:Ionotropic glutamate receptor C-terminal domain-containing protein n=1 Tax=Oryctes borbonicus TaxID=1629725 RepID=A0A0T6AUS3_9SCAR|nr:hypothetical protein AMK59_7965 [Oryctes borbonicus]
MIIAVVVYIIVVWEWKYRDQNVLPNTPYALRPKFVDVLVMELGAICQQGSEAEPRSTSGRIATIFIFVAVSFMYTFYSANIVALLQSTSESIQTLEDLLTSRIKLGAEDIPYSKFFFKVTYIVNLTF